MAFVAIGEAGVIAQVFKKPILLLALLVVGLIVYLVFPAFGTGVACGLIAYAVIWVLNGFHKWPLPSLGFIVLMFCIGFASQTFSIFSFVPATTLTTVPSGTQAVTSSGSAPSGIVQALVVIIVIVVFSVIAIELYERKKRL